MARRICLLAVAAALVVLLLTAHLRWQLEITRSQLVQAQRHAHELERKALAAQGETQQKVEATIASAEALPRTSLQARWDWFSMVKEMIQPFSQITPEMLDAAVRTCFDNGTMYCMRAQVVSGNLYITDYRAIFFDRWYAPARVMALLDVLRWHEVPDVDIVVAAVDEPRVKMSIDELHWTRTVQAYPGATTDAKGRRVVKLPPPLFSSTINRASHDLPWPDFSFYTPRKSHKLRTPPWSILHGKMLEESARVRWEDKIELAMHTGNVGSPYRKKLAAVAEANPEAVLVNELFIGDHGKITQTCKQLNLHTTGGYQKHKCYMTFEDQCSYKYLLNSASIGYANKFKYLLLCGSVVIYVQEGMAHKEFYEYGLVAGVHYVTARTAKEVPGLVRYLKANDAYARSVAAAGRERMAALDVKAIAAFNAELLGQYAKRQRFTVKPLKGAVRIECEDDLWRHYARDVYFMRHFIVEDNSTCIHKISGPFKAPGYGGAYNGSKVRCVAAHDQRRGAQPLMCSPGAVVEEDQNPGERFKHRIISTTRPVQPGTSYASFDEFPVAGNDGIPWRTL
ncbi:hypothetical protein AB1Y20_007517 [Prymnesium parvum]|uniref:Glycosyl transferase CAP10 domain-containing protein n=1 Tax=Prymnesium parvum TaxID=97485 RepID=A0AB34IXW7_PRYPA